LQRHLKLVLVAEPKHPFHFTDDGAATKLEFLSASAGARLISIDSHLEVRL
jgi:hypothetical protein